MATLMELADSALNVKGLFDADGKIDLETFTNFSSPFNSGKRALSNNLYGINHQQVKGILPENRDTYGLTFFTRPMLNLSDSNLRRVRGLTPFLNNNPRSLHMYIRNMLSPRLAGSYYEYDPTNDDDAPLTDTEKSDLKSALQSSDIGGVMLLTEQQVKVTSKLIDNNIAFIPFLTNNLIELSGWPDLVLPHYVSPEGVRKQQWMMADGTFDYFSSYDIDCTFKNTKDEPIVMLFDLWERYMAGVHEGMLAPHLDMEVEGEMDYNTRIYRLILDESKLFVKKIAACGAAFPVNVPNGKFYDFSESEKYNTSNSSISIRFTCVGAMYGDPILVHEFNQTQAIFSDNYKQWLNGDSESTLEEIPFNLLHLFNYRGYPYIDYSTHQLRWLISTKTYAYKNVVKYLTEAVTNNVRYYY